MFIGVKRDTVPLTPNVNIKGEGLAIMNEEFAKKWDAGVHFAVTILSVTLCVFEMYTAFWGLLPGMQQTALHYALVAAIGFLLNPISKEGKLWGRLLDALLAAVIIACMMYIFVNNVPIMLRFAQVDKVSNLQLALGTITTLMVIELTRRTLGWALPIIALIFVAYAFVGPHLGGVLYYRGISFERFIEQMYLTTTAIFGEPMKISATYVFLFVLFGAFLEISGAGEFFMEISKSMVGRFRGGPGLMAVISSALMGTISGSAVANVATTGSFSIPMMQRSGYENNYAGGVVAVASAGGQILPPVMGSAAFIMAEYLGVTYGDIIRFAAIPAILYFAAVFIQVYFTARKENLQGTPASEIKKAIPVLLESGYLALPLLGIIYMLVSGYSAMRSGFIGIILIVAFSALKKKTRIGPKKILKAMLSAGKSIIAVASACACAGIIISVVSFSGLGLKFSSAVLALSNNILSLALVFTMLSSIVLGMGLPTTASYIIQATLTAPALITLGLLPIQAHLFVFYFACIAVITPPVALAAYTAAPMCGGNAVTVGMKAFKLGITAFIIPFLFAYRPELLLIGSAGGILLQVTVASICCCSLAIGLTGWCFGDVSLPLRALMVVNAIFFIIPSFITDVTGTVILIVLIIIQRIMQGRGHKSLTV